MPSTDTRLPHSLIQITTKAPPPVSAARATIDVSALEHVDFVMKGGEVMKKGR